MRRQEYLRPLFAERPDRVGRDRLEILTALISGPSFDPIFRPDVIVIPRGHAIYRWECVVGRCERSRTGGSDLCSEHQRQWVHDSGHGAGRAAFVPAPRVWTGTSGPKRSSAGSALNGPRHTTTCGCASGN
jgi:hypothetical protein